MARPTDASSGQKPQVEGASGPEVRTGGGTAAMGSLGTQVTKVIVAVHGVGDQYSFATIQAVVNRFCSFYHEPAAVPLGNFHTGQKTFSLRPPYPQELFGHLAFAEVYWAKIPRTVVDDKHTLEEAKEHGISRTQSSLETDPAYGTPSQFSRQGGIVQWKVQRRDGYSSLSETRRFRTNMERFSLSYLR